MVCVGDKWGRGCQRRLTLLTVSGMLLLFISIIHSFMSTLLNPLVQTLCKHWGYRYEWPNLCLKELQSNRRGNVPDTQRVQVRRLVSSIGTGNQERPCGKNDLCLGSRLQIKKSFLISSLHRPEHLPPELRTILAANENQSHCDNFFGLNYPHRLLD